MAAEYLCHSTHYSNWIFTDEELKFIDQLREKKFKRAYEDKQKKGVPIHVRSFACLVPKRSTAVAAESSWEDSIELTPDSDVMDTTEEGIFLSLEEEALIRRFYQEKVEEACTQLFRTSDKVKASAVMLYKRFYLSNSVMEYHPKYIVPSVIYVAGKVEEQYISVDTIDELLRVDHKDVIAHELIVLQGVRFQTIIYHPFRSLLGFLEDARLYFKAANRPTPVDIVQEIHTQSVQSLNEMMQSDLPLKYNSSVLALAGLRHGSAEYDQFDLEEYLRENNSINMNVEQLLGMLNEISAELQEFKKVQLDPKQVKPLYKKLKHFYPQSEEPKKKKRKKDKK